MYALLYIKPRDFVRNFRKKNIKKEEKKKKENE